MIFNRSSVGLFFILLLAGCRSAEDESRIRLAVSAFDQADTSDAKMDGPQMAELARAIDLVQDDTARRKLRDCQSAMLGYKRAQFYRNLAFDENLRKFKVEPTEKMMDAAMEAAKKEHPVDPTSIAQCSTDLIAMEKQ